MSKVYVTQTHRGKMEGLSSISTSILDNKFCNKMRKAVGTICSKCYGYSTEKAFTDCSARWKENSDKLSKRELTEKEIPLFRKIRPIRFHSFGELTNLRHLKNLLKIVVANPHIQFTLWTKRKNLINRLGETVKLPNLILVYSAPRINVRPDKKDETLKLFDRIFTVYTKDYIKKNRVNINCQKKCAGCMLCYSKNRTIYINELIK